MASLRNAVTILLAVAGMASAADPHSLVILAAVLAAQTNQDQAAGADSPYNVRLPVTPADLRIVRRAREILKSPAKWDRADTRVCRVKRCKSGCPTGAKAFSLYCALEKATDEVTGDFEHRGAAMQEARFVIDVIAPNRRLPHRLQGFNNDPAITFADIQKVLRLLEDRISKRLTEAAQPSKK